MLNHLTPWLNKFLPGKVVLDYLRQKPQTENTKHQKESDKRRCS